MYPAIPVSGLLVGVIMMKRIDPGTKPDRTCCAGKYGTILAVLAILVCFALISPVTAVSAEGGTVLPVDEAGVIPVLIGKMSVQCDTSQISNSISYMR